MMFRYSMYSISDFVAAQYEARRTKEQTSGEDPGWGGVVLLIIWGPGLVSLVIFVVDFVLNLILDFVFFVWDTALSLMSFVVGFVLSPLVDFVFFVWDTALSLSICVNAISCIICCCLLRAIVTAILKRCWIDISSRWRSPGGGSVAGRGTSAL